MPPHLLLVHAGPALPALVARFGDFDRWFLEAVAPVPVRWTVVRPFAGEPLPDLDGLDGAIMTGSYASVRDRAPWMLRAEDWLRGVVARSFPFFGVCFGHQLLGSALGGRVVRNPRGLELGTVDITLTEAGRADPLFAGFGAGFEVHETHEDMVVDLPASVRVLAANPWTPVQALAAGACAWGVQFHPEFTRASLSEAAALHGGPVPRIAEAPESRRLLQAFVQRL